MIDNRTCTKCKATMTLREASYHNMIPKVAGTVCYACFKDYHDNLPLNPDDYARCPKCNQVVYAKDYVREANLCLACVRGLGPLDEEPAYAHLDED